MWSTIRMKKKPESIINNIVDDYYNFNIHQYGSKVFEKCMCDELPCPQDKREKETCGYDEKGQ